MSRIYRSDQSVMSFASEAGPGGFLDYLVAIDDAGDWTAVLTGVHLPGSKSLNYISASGALPVGAYISIGSIAQGNYELRKTINVPPTGTHDGGAAAASLTDTSKNFVALGVVVGDTLENVTDISSTTITAITTTTNSNDTLVGVLGGGGSNDWGVGETYRLTSGRIYIDAPTGFYHASADVVDEKSATLTGLSGDSLVTFIPGAWDSITVPDLVPEITPYYFMGTSSDRNFTVAYRGKQTFTGSIPNFILLNGYPLRFPIGTITTTGTDVGGGGASTLTGNHYKGERTITVGATTNYGVGNYIQIGTGSTAEVREIISIDALVITLNYPLMFNHSGGVALNEVEASFTHTILSNFNLDSMSWNVLMRDSEETVANDFLRRFFGGKVGRATISAEENEKLMMSWDEIPFLGFLHNQRFHEDVGAGATDIIGYTGALIDPTQESTDFRAVGGARPAAVASSSLGEASYPITEPYYFSQGSISLFGQTLARIRNFSLEINNNLDPRYYIANAYLNRRPYEILEQRREYKMTATIALPDSTAAATSTTPTLFKELILEGVYGTSMQGFDITLVFTRGTNDSITITIPPSAAATGIDGNGAFILNAPHGINPNENPVQVPVEILFRDLSIVISDAIGVYP